MTSLDGYSLNEKMDNKFEDIQEQIEALHFRIETEIDDIVEKFAELTKAASKKPKVKKEKTYAN